MMFNQAQDINYPGPSGKVVKYADLEAADGSLYPGISAGENALRLGFIRKVYGILTVQLLLTTAVAGFVMFTPGVKETLAGMPGLLTITSLLPLIGMIPLYCYRYSHPLNLVFLGVWTLCLSTTVGMICTQYSGLIVFQAILITAVVTSALTIYTFVGVKKGQDYGYLGPMLFAGLCSLIVWGFLQMFFPASEGTRFVYALIGAAIFSMYIVYDTNELIKRYSVDEYVWATVGLYLDIINLFIKMLEILSYLQNRD